MRKAALWREFDSPFSPKKTPLAVLTGLGSDRANYVARTCAVHAGLWLWRSAALTGP
uniref:Uncharacterized protein n=1 Tax=Arundo donax TaxID=35708 RepID=A0A0A8YYD3_ARUDO